MDSIAAYSVYLSTLAAAEIATRLPSTDLIIDLRSMLVDACEVSLKAVEGEELDNKILFEMIDRSQTMIEEIDKLTPHE